MILTIGATLLAVTLGTVQVDTTVVVRAGSRLDIHALSGEVVIRTWERNEVRIEAEQDSRTQLRVTREGSVVHVRSERVRGGPQRVDYRITVPVAMDLSIGGVNMDIDIEGTRGQVEASTVSGDVRLVGGQGLIHVSAINGDVEVEASRGTIDASSVSGSVLLRNIQGTVEAESVSGRLILDQIASGDVVAETVSGRIYFDGTIDRGGRYEFATHSGSITLGVPANTNATVSISQMSGSFSSSLDALRDVRVRRGSRERITLGSGDGLIEVESFSGRIRIGRRGEVEP